MANMTGDCEIAWHTVHTHWHADTWRQCRWQLFAAIHGCEL